MKNHEIIISRLVLIGKRKNYEVPFNPGVNIIYGDADTGKSSVLELINYMLGASSFVVNEEIELSVNYAMLEISLAGTPHVIKRNIFRPQDLIEVYQSSLDMINTTTAERYSPNYQSEGPNGFFSDFLLLSLNLPIIRVRQSPNQEESKIVRLGFRDIFKYCYLNQDDVGSKRILEHGGNWAVFQKNKQTFKYVFGLLDTEISDIEENISSTSTKKSALERKFASVNDFLSEAEVESSSLLNSTFDQLEAQIQDLEFALEDIKGRIISDSESYRTLRFISQSNEEKISYFRHEKSESEIISERYLRLKNDYINDIEKLYAAQVAKTFIGDEKPILSICPICESEYSTDKSKLHFDSHESVRVEKEIKTLKGRLKEIDNLLIEERNKQNQFIAELDGLHKERESVRRMLDEETAEMISPYITERDGILSELSAARERKNRLAQALKVRNQQDKISTEIGHLVTQLNILDDQLKKAKEKTTSLDSTLSNLANYLNKYLLNVKIKNRRDVSIDESSFLPRVRGKHYSEITSGGLRTIVSIGHFLSIMQSSINNEATIPGFLMIDTVGKYLGKTKEKYLDDTDRAEDNKENISDPEMYENIYEHMIALSSLAEENGKNCQIILVDNDVPPAVQRKYSGFIVAHYGAAGEKVGLIDDWDQSRYISPT